MRMFGLMCAVLCVGLMPSQAMATSKRVQAEQEYAYACGVEDSAYIMRDNAYASESTANDRAGDASAARSSAQTRMVNNNVPLGEQATKLAAVDALIAAGNAHLANFGTHMSSAAAYMSYGAVAKSFYNTFWLIGDWGDALSCAIDAGD